MHIDDMRVVEVGQRGPTVWEHSTTTTLLSRMLVHSPVEDKNSDMHADSQAPEMRISSIQDRRSGHGDVQTIKGRIKSRISYGME